MTSHIPHPAAGSYVSAYVPVDLVLPGKRIVTMPFTLKSGSLYKVGSVMGLVQQGAATAAAKSGGNTGNGTFTIDATNPTRINAKVGVWTLRCIEVAVASNNDGLFELRDPEGITRGTYAIPTGGGGSVTVDDGIKGALVDGSTNYILGDGFDITVPAGTGYATLSAAAAQDGSAVPMGILLEEIDCTGGAKQVPLAIEGYFNEDALTYGAGHTPDTVRLALRDAGIHIRTVAYSG